MAMIAGSVTIADDGTPTKSGAAEAVYDALVAAVAVQPGGLTFRVAQLRGLAVQANAIAAIIPYITTNGKARVTATDSGLQRTPNPNNADTATQAPVGNVDIALV